MYLPLTETEIEICEHLCDPTSMTENLFPENFNAPQTWSVDSQNIYVRPYQFAFQNYSYIIADDPELSKNDNFRFKKLSGTCFSIAARNLGKSLWILIDVILSVIHMIKEGCVAAPVAEKLKKVTEPIASFVESHPFLKIFHLKDTRSSSVKRDYLTIKTEHGATILSANEKVDSDKPGIQYHGKHWECRWVEEKSYCSKIGEEKAKDSEMSYGHIDRDSGIPDLCMDSPLGKILNDKNKKSLICRLPQMVREDWTEKVEQEKLEEYGGFNAAYRLNVLAETIEGAFGFWDIGRLKEIAIKQNSSLKKFEVTKESFYKFEQILSSIERMPGTESCYLCGDLGAGAAPTEIIIIFYDGKKYKYLYNISLLRIIADEQIQILKYLYDKLGSAFVALDSGHDNGATVDYLYKAGIPSEHLLKVIFTANIEVDFERDAESGNMIIDANGEPVMKKANTRQWAMQQLQKLLYSGDVEIPFDDKFITQFTNMIAKKSGTNILYECKGEDHNHQAFEVWAICQFLNKLKTTKDQRQQKTCLGVINIRRK